MKSPGRYSKFARQNLLGLLALAVALGGTAFAASKAPKNSVVSKSIKNGGVKLADLAPDSVDGSKVVDGSLGGADLGGNSLLGSNIDEATLGKVPDAANADRAASADTAASASTAETAASATSAETAASANNAAALGGNPPSDYRRWAGTIPSGKTVTGAWGCSHATDFAGGTGRDCTAHVQLPAPAPTALTDATVNSNPGPFGADDDATCTGSEADPTAPAGKVCIYLSLRAFNTQSSITGTVDSAACGCTVPGYHTRGFMVDIRNVDNPGDSQGVWAYTAP
jgi:hypothetical protein